MKHRVTIRPKWDLDVRQDIVVDCGEKETEVKNQHCEDCLYFNRGLCRRRPPVIVVSERYGDDENHVKSYQYGSSFPDTHKTDWCGEWRCTR